MDSNLAHSSDFPPPSFQQRRNPHEDDWSSSGSESAWSSGAASATVTVNGAVGDELSLGDDDFEYLPAELRDDKLSRVAGQLEAMLNEQLLAPIINQTNSVFGKRRVRIS